MTRNHGKPNSSEAPGGEPLSGPPRWVKVAGLITGIVVLLAIAVMLFSGGEHGPSRHLSGATGPGPASDVVLTEASGPDAGRGMFQA